MNSTSTSKYNKRLSDDNFWGSMEVISEPIFGQNKNINSSGGAKVAVEGDKVYVVWVDNTSYNGAGPDLDIFFRFFDGSSWSEIQVISEPVPGKDINYRWSYYPDIAVENGKIYVVWSDNNNTNGAGWDYDIFYRCKLTGSGWENIQVLSEPVFGKNFNTEESSHPVIAVDNGKIYVAWEDKNNTNGAETDDDIFYRCNLTGLSWDPIQVISEPIPTYNFNKANSYKPAIAVENDNIYIVWEDGNDTNGAGSSDFDIFYKCNLTGSGWKTVQVISEPIESSNTNVEFSRYPSIAVENGKIYVVWHDENNTTGAGFPDKDIFYRCNLSGSSWEPVQVISEPVLGNSYNTGDSQYPSIAIENGTIYVVWQDNNNTGGAGLDRDIFYKCNRTGQSWEAVQVISEPLVGGNINTDYSSGPDIAVYFNRSHVVWSDRTNINGAGTDFDIFYRGMKIIPLTLSLPSVAPISGNTDTEFNFTVIYIHEENMAPKKITVEINGENCSMLETNASNLNYKDGKSYYYNTKLNISDKHIYQFWASDDSYTIFTAVFDCPDVYNTPPKIVTEDNLTAIEDIYYEVNYEYEDIDLANVGQLGTWNFSTNATWLNFNPTNACLYGIPTNDEIGKYWVNITVNDTIDIDHSNFTLTVIDINDNPIINTSNVEITYEDAVYSIDYNATDVDSIIKNQIWSLGTNASSWLSIESNSGILNGTPTNDEIGNYWVNVSVNDGEDGFDYTNFTLTVLNVNDPPIIVTEDVITARVGKLYEVDYNATDIDSPLSQQTWVLDSNATWLSVNQDTGVLLGTPSITDIGWYNVNVTVDDSNSGLDWHEFILTVSIGNLPPLITTEDVLTATVNKIYEVDYNATDGQTPLYLLFWSVETNASWLNIEINTGILTGVPTSEDVGWFWVNVSVHDGEDGWDYHNFILTVLKEPIEVNNPPELTNPQIIPSEGNTETEFIFSVYYNDADADKPTFIQVVIDNTYFNMTLETWNASRGTYKYSTKLSKGYHSYYFIASDGLKSVKTDNSTTPNIKKVDRISKEESFWYWLILVIVIAIIAIAVIFLFVYKKRKAAKIPTVRAEILYAPPEQIALPSVTPGVEGELSLPQPTPAPQLPTQKVQVQPAIATLGEKVLVPSLPPRVVQPQYQLPQATLTNAQQLGLLKEQLLRGEISEGTYKELKTRIEIPVEEEVIEEGLEGEQPSATEQQQQKELIEEEPAKPEVPSSVLLEPTVKTFKEVPKKPESPLLQPSVEPKLAEPVEQPEKASQSKLEPELEGKEVKDIGSKPKEEQKES